MNAAQEAAFEAKAEKHFRSHRELPSGRNFRCWNREKDVDGDRNYSRNYEDIDWTVDIAQIRPTWA